MTLAIGSGLMCYMCERVWPMKYSMRMKHLDRFGNKFFYSRNQTKLSFRTKEGRERFGAKWFSPKQGYHHNPNHFIYSK